MNKKGWTTAEKNVSTSFGVRAEPKSWSKYTTSAILCNYIIACLQISEFSKHSNFGPDRVFSYKLFILQFSNTLHSLQIRDDQKADP